MPEGDARKRRKSQRQRLCTAVTVAFVGLTACSGGSSGSTAHTGTDVARMIGCAGYADAASPAVAVGPKSLATGSCTLDHERVVITVYSDSKTLHDAESLSKSMACAYAKPSAKKGWFAEGSNWAAAPRSEATATKAAANAHAKLRSISC